jgi:hypothetical protein
LASILLGSDAYWALDSVQQKLKYDVISAKKTILSVQKEIGTAKEGVEWNKKPNFTRAVMLMLPGPPVLNQQSWRELW